MCEDNIKVDQKNGVRNCGLDAYAWFAGFFWTASWTVEFPLKFENFLTNWQTVSFARSFTTPRLCQ